MRRRYFDGNWTGDAAVYIEEMIRKNRGIWEKEYRQNTTVSASQVPQSTLSAFIANIIASQPEQIDDFERYINGNTTNWVEWRYANIYQWWMTCDYPQLRQWAFDALSIPAMSSELERVFAQSGRFITKDRNRLLATKFEAIQCLLHWGHQGIYDIMNPERNNDLPTNQGTPFA